MSYVLKNEVVVFTKEFNVTTCDVCGHYNGFKKTKCGNGCTMPLTDEKSEKCYCFEYSDRYETLDGHEYKPTEYDDNED